MFTQVVRMMSSWRMWRAKRRRALLQQYYNSLNQSLNNNALTSNDADEHAIKLKESVNTVHGMVVS